MIFQNFVRAFLKAAGHRYIKRIPYNTPKGRRYRYIYRVSSTHQGRHAFDAEHLVENTKFALHGEGESEFHGHITKVDGDQIKYVIDDGPRKGEEVTTSRQRLVDELNLVHGVQDKLTAEREKVRGAIAEAKRAGHGGVVRRLERRLRALGGEPEAQPTEPTEYGTHISEEDIATYKRIAEEGPDALADMSDDEITRLMLQHGRNVDARSRAVQDEINAARDELKHFELMRELERAEGRLTIHPVRQQDRDEHARLSEEFARVDAEYKRRSEEAQKRHVYTDPVLGRHDDSAHHLTMEHYERKEKREAEEERRTKGSKLYQSLNVENAKGMREKHDAEVRRQRREAPEQRAMGSLSAIAKEFNHEDAYEIAERAIEERPRDALIVADLIQTTPDNANRISIPLTIRLAELIHGEPSPEAHSPRESHLMDIHSTLDMKEQRKKNGTRSNYSKREVSEALDKLREHVRRFYPEDDPTAFAEMRGQIREAIEGVIATYEKSLAEDTKDEARIKRALERLEAISKGEIEAQPTEPEPEAQPAEPTESVASEPKKRAPRAARPKTHGSKLSDANRETLGDLSDDAQRRINERRMTSTDNLSFDLRRSPEGQALSTRIDRALRRVEDPKKLFRGIPAQVVADLRSPDEREVNLFGVTVDSATDPHPRLFLSEMKSVQGKELNPINVEPSEGGATFKLYTTPDMTSPDGKVSVAFGTVTGPDGKRQNGIFMVDTTTGRRARIDATVKPHQAPFVLSALARYNTLSSALANVDVNDVESMRHLRRSISTSRIVRGQYTADFSEAITRILAQE